MSNLTEVENILAGIFAAEELKRRSKINKNTYEIRIKKLENTLKSRFREYIWQLLNAKDIKWNLIDKVVSIEDIESEWNGYSGEFWDSPMHNAIDSNDIELVKGIIKHGNGLLGDTDHYRWHEEEEGCSLPWNYKHFIIASMKLEMMKALEIDTTREEMIEARKCIFKEEPDKTYTAFMDNVMDMQHNKTMAELNRLVPGSVNKQNINYNKTIKNINNILYPPKYNTKKKILTRNKKGGTCSSRTRKRRV